MGRKLATFILPAIVGYSSATLALGLGGIESDSYLNEPLDARIPLVSATAAELENLRVSLASPEAFERAGLSRPFYLSPCASKSSPTRVLRTSESPPPTR